MQTKPRNELGKVVIGSSSDRRVGDQREELFGRCRLSFESYESLGSRGAHLPRHNRPSNELAERFRCLLAAFSNEIGNGLRTLFEVKSIIVSLGSGIHA